MIAWRSKPWASKKDRLLFVAAFSDDPESAVAAAMQWFQETDIEDIQYIHHRLIAAIGNRFAAHPDLDPHRSMIRRVSKQLWLRGTRAMSALGRVTPILEEMRVPWAVVGNAVWQCKGGPLFRDVEQPELMVEQAAYTFTVSRFWDAGWLPPTGAKLYGMPDPISMTDAFGNSVLLRSDITLKDAFPTLTNEALWGATTPHEAFNSMFRLPSSETILRLSALADFKPNADFQWAVDLNELRRSKQDLRLERGSSSARLKYRLKLLDGLSC